MFSENYKKNGCIEVVCGSMFSGKTEELIRRLKRAQFAKQKIVIFQPTVDNRYSDGEVAKKAGKHYGVLTLLLKPHWQFFSSFVLRGGFLDGKRGLIRAGLNAFYKFALIAKIMEQDLRNQKHES
jgi:hypothetical protein